MQCERKLFYQPQNSGVLFLLKFLENVNNDYNLSISVTLSLYIF